MKKQKVRTFDNTDVSGNFIGTLRFHNVKLTFTYQKQ